MGISVELFSQDKNEDWEYMGCIYTSMIGPSRNLISNTVNGFVWGGAKKYNGCGEWYLEESSKISATKMSFGVLKKIWKLALDEDIKVSNKNINDLTIVCIATGE